jgi:hypothetical protein
MRLLQKMICDRCFMLYHAELEAEGWFSVQATRTGSGQVVSEGVCSFCGKVEGRKTVQIESPFRDKDK